MRPVQVLQGVPVGWKGTGPGGLAAASAFASEVSVLRSSPRPLEYWNSLLFLMWLNFVSIRVRTRIR